MRPFPLLKCIAKVLLKAVGNALGFGLGDVVADIADGVWNEWNKGKEEADRRAEVQELLNMAGAEFCQQVRWASQHGKRLGY
jgi:hypothetical protein